MNHLNEKLYQDLKSREPETIAFSKVLINHIVILNGNGARNPSSGSSSQSSLGGGKPLGKNWSSLFRLKVMMCLLLQCQVTSILSSIESN